MAHSKSPNPKKSTMPSEPAGSRRDFLKGATTVAAGLMMPGTMAAQHTESLPTIKLGPHRVSRLIVGSNPIYGYSHFNYILDRLMREYFTDERIVKLMLDCEKHGVNTWQASFNYDMKRQFPKIRGAGCNIQFICLAASWHYDPKMGRTPEEVLDGTIKCAQAAMEFKPIGIAFHGGATDILFRAGKIDLIKTYIDRVHEMGTLAGISTHNPRILETLHEKGFANDFYMAGLQYLTRRPEEWMKEIGAHPLDEGWIDSDPPRMAAAVRRVDKPTLVYKVLAAGRKCRSEGQKRQAIEWAYQNIKPIDATIIGLFPRFSDQVTETARMVREVLA
ncbi:MAG: twin-arginine translocation signal domain-containing protein [Terriglobia bacterium]